MAGLRSEVDPGVELLKQVGSSSNLVYRAEAPDRAYGLRIPRLNPTEFSAFWEQIHSTYGHDYTSRPASPDWITKEIKGAGLGAAEQLAELEVNQLRASVVVWMAGEEWEPDAFPADPKVNWDLGDFLGRMHSGSYSGFGSHPDRLVPVERYVERSVQSIRQVLNRHWPEELVHYRFNELVRGLEENRVATRCCLIMADLSGNQFTYADGSLDAVIDLDAYVVGPIEHELTLAEWTTTAPEAFRAGYEQHRPLPRFSPFRAFYRFMMLVNEPDCSPEEFDRAMQESIHFD